ncbi:MULTISPECIES: sulfatase [Enterococcus]|nr:sulfatase [Enterococcus avium]HAP3020786.1 sulfatase [Enterococcus faecalis]AYQ24033.1 sulfatase [Enterococcus avium]HBI1561122.1 sulfatase [Enterococcus faecalis]HBI1564395.1 sulfatase [Enterococcus faecalis]HBI1716961.1 sulfatase [Enterococcus faecalis]
MRTILVLMDTLRKDVLSAYNPRTKVKTPNIDAFAADSLVFDNHYIGSTPCMPARRDLMTGRLNFLERSWGPIEPFDVTFPKLLQENDIYSHLTTDHTHYFRLGGEGYINQFTTWDFHRGQEGDPWVSKIRDPEWMPEQYYGRLRKQYQANREKWINDEEAYPTPRTFRSACDWLEENKGETDFYLQVEVFDPHEPFDVPDQYMNIYNSVYEGPFFETPIYGKVDVPCEAVEYIQQRYAALVTMTDNHFGRLIAKLKELDMYEDTLIILTSDHGYLLGDHGLFGKNYMHNYNELAAIPLMVRDPEGKRRGEHTNNVSQNIDIMPTVLEYYGIAIPEDVRGHSWVSIINGGSNGKTHAIYGAHGITVNITDGNYTYFRAPKADNQPLFEYAGIPTTIRHYIGESDPTSIEIGRFLMRTQYPVFKVPINHPAILDGLGDMSAYTRDSLLFDLKRDPLQMTPLQEREKEAEMIDQLIRVMTEMDAPQEQYQRLALI